MKFYLGLLPTFFSIPIYYVLVSLGDPNTTVTILIFVSACGVVSLFDFGLSITPNLKKSPVTPRLRNIGVIFLTHLSVLNVVAKLAVKFESFDVSLFSFWEVAIYTTLMSITNYTKIAIDLNFQSTAVLSFIRGLSSVFRLLPVIIFTEFLELSGGISVFIFFEVSYIVICKFYSFVAQPRADFDYLVDRKSLIAHWLVSLALSVLDLFIKGNIFVTSGSFSFFVYDVASRLVVVLNLFSSLCIRLIQTLDGDLTRHRVYLNAMIYLVILVCFSGVVVGWPLEVMFLLSVFSISIQSVVELGFGSLRQLILSKALVGSFFSAYIFLRLVG